MIFARQFFFFANGALAPEGRGPSSCAKKKFVPGKKLAARYREGRENRMTKKKGQTSFLKKFLLKNFERNFYLLSKITSVRGPLTIKCPGPPQWLMRLW